MTAKKTQAKSSKSATPETTSNQSGGPEPTPNAGARKSPRPGPAADRTKRETKKAPREERVFEEDLVVFAFRLTADEREAIHKAAGPARASRFVRTLAVAAARKDKGAVNELIAAIA